MRSMVSRIPSDLVMMRDRLPSPMREHYSDYGEVVVAICATRHGPRRGSRAEHWIHLRTTNPIESTFATVRLR